MAALQATSRAEIDSTIAAFSRRTPHVFFVQIGSNDGVQCDPIRPYIVRDRWSGVLVEPVPYLYERLRALYARRRDLRVENCAVADEDGVRTLYRLRDPGDGDPRWHDGLGTFFPDVLLKNRWSIPGLEERICSEQVRCLTLDSLFRRHAIRRLDLLHVDTEGFDGQVLRQLDFARFRPSLILFEHKHLEPAERASTYALLRRNGYSVAVDEHDGDSLAVRSWRTRLRLSS